LSEKTKAHMLGLRVLLSSKEMSKSCIMYNSGKRNLKNGDLTSSGVNFYYSLYHACLSVVSSTSNKIVVENCIIEQKRREQLPRYYIPLNHTDARNLIGHLDKDLTNELDKLMQIREYLSYGPNILYEPSKLSSISHIIVYDCRFPSLRHEIERMRSELPKLITRCCGLLEKNLSEGNFYYFMYYFYKMTNIICKGLNLDPIFISECQSILDPFDKTGIRDLANKS